LHVLGIDTGGTFTDVVAPGPGGLAAWKVPSTPWDPARAVLAAIEAVGGLPPDGRVHHGTTVATNTVLTRTGARTALVATEGFEDVLHLGRGHRLDLHDLAPHRIPPLVERRDVHGLRERTGPRGEVRRRLASADLEHLCAAILRSGAETVAVCLLHATVSGANEDRVASRLRRAGLPVHVSHRVTADAREAERAEATVLDAYVGPRMRAYVARVAAALPSGALSVLRSDGTRMAALGVEREPGRTLLSGPAAGVAAAHALGRRLELARLLSFDVGGTSTDVAWVEGEVLPVTTGLTLAGFAMGVPSLDVHSVGAGGGSVVALDAGGALRVGPESAGADPGPACYGRGGPFTVTDAHLLLGRLPPALLDGTFPLDAGAARAAAERLARRAGVTPRAVAEGAVAVAEVATARALRVASAAAGRDPRGAALLAFGGAGGLLGARVAAQLGLAEVVVPWSPGTFAAQGARAAPRAADVSTAVHGMAIHLERAARRLADESAALLLAGGDEPASIHLEVDARYVGQGAEIVVPFSGDWRAAFHEAHRWRRGWADPARSVEAVRLRARAVGPPGATESAAGVGGPAGDPDRPTAAAGTFTGLAGDVPWWRRADLPRGAELSGPGVVVEDGATTWVPPGTRLRAEADGTLRLRGGPR
jgi:N-methylhydantoinase A